MRIPKGEQIWVRYTCNGVTKYVVTSKEKNRDIYFLYEIEGEKAVKIAKNKNPMALEDAMKKSN